MADQMAPAEMRGKAHALRLSARPKPHSDQMFPPDLELAAFRENVLAGADALDRLADVIEYAERITGSNRADSPYVLERASHQSALRILAFAHGETNEGGR